MPELPEVETIKNDLSKRILDKKIIQIEVRDKKIIRQREADFIKFVKNNYFKKIRRTGKLLVFELKNKDIFLLIHLKMTGQLIYVKKGEITAGGHEESLMSADKLPNKYTRLIFVFSDRSKLFYNDLRRFGYLKIVGKKELGRIIKQYGPEPLSPDFNFKELKSILADRKAPVKAVMLNQSLIAGIGNIYVDEILFKAGVSPKRPSGSLIDQEIKKISAQAKAVIKKAVEYRGTTFSDYLDSKGKEGNFSQFLQVYSRTGEKCPRCKGIVKKEKIAGRGTHYCQKCQR